MIPDAIVQQFLRRVDPGPAPGQRYANEIAQMHGGGFAPVGPIAGGPLPRTGGSVYPGLPTPVSAARTSVAPNPLLQALLAHLIAPVAHGLNVPDEARPGYDSGHLNLGPGPMAGQNSYVVGGAQVPSQPLPRLSPLQEIARLLRGGNHQITY